MLVRFNVFALVVILILLQSCATETSSGNEYDKLDIELQNALKEQSPTGNMSYYRLPESTDFNAIPQDPRNPLSRAKVVLGGFLFHETAISVDAKDSNLNGTFSCASCHHASAGFQAGTFQGIGEGGQGFGVRGENRTPMSHIVDADVQPVKSPSSMNGAYQPNQLWNGQFGATYLNEGTESQWPYGTPIETNRLGYEGLETQAIAGMSVHRLNISMDLLDIPTYKLLFDEAFGDIPEDKRYTKEFAGLAIAAFERTVLSNEAPFQEYLKGNTNALTNQEKNGALLFFTKASCSSCHTGPALNKMQFNVLGMGDLINCPEPTLKTKLDDPANLGRGGFTKKAADNFAFKVPQLYNLLDSPFYGHGSSFRTIREVLDYKNAGVAQNSNVPVGMIDPRFRPLELTENEINDLEAFISRGLYDPNLTRYVPNSLPSGLCFPNADMPSRIDMGCL